MKTNSIRSLVASCALALFVATSLPLQSAPVGTAFTYQGRLTEQGQPANGIYDFRFVIRDAPAGGNSLRGAETKLAVPVRDGVFSLAIDFGSSVFDGDLRWLDIETRTNGAAAFTPLAPLQPLRPTPYAIAAHALNGTLPASQVTGSLGSAALAGSYENPVSFISPSNHFTGDGSGLKFGGFSYTNLPFYWNVKGNAGTTPGQNFVGTLDAQPLELRVNGQRALRLEPTSVSPNLIGGFGGNYADAGVVGSTIGGGGAADAPNRIAISSSADESPPPEFATIGGGLGNLIRASSYATIGGGANNQVSQPMWGDLPTAKQYNTIAGGFGNAVVGSWMSTIAGGQNNGFLGDLGHDIKGGAIGGGVNNHVSTLEDTAYYPTIAGGFGNRLSQGWYLTVGGGGLNNIGLDSHYSTIGGGNSNSIGSVTLTTTISGGSHNAVDVLADGSTIAGGSGNLVHRESPFSSISGGMGNTVGEQAGGAVISGGEANQVWNFADHATIGGGWGNLIGSNAVDYGGGLQVVQNATIGGGRENAIYRGADYATISGGTSNLINVFARGALIAGGRQNTLSEWCTDSVISGGYSNYMGWYAVGASIGGGVLNTVRSDTFYSTIAGGVGNTAGARNSYGVTVGGGVGNGMGDEIFAATIGGGATNGIFGRYSHYATIGGGSGNRIAPISFGATIGGGEGNTIGQFEHQDSSGQFGWYAVISGGLSNRAITPYSTVAGGRFNVAGGSNSFAAGFRAQAINDGTFVWADLQDAAFASTGTNQFLIRASGGVGINTDSPQFALHVNGEAGKPGGGAWSVASDARLKKDIRPLEQALARLLQLHGVTYEYKDPKSIHELPGQQTGMVAQEVEKVFPEWVETAPDGMRRLSIRGFEALTVEALRDLRTEKDEQIRARDEQISAMEKRLAALEERVAK